MGEFYAWAAIGQVTRLTTWRGPDLDTGKNQQTGGNSTVFIASRMVEGQQFVLRQRDGEEVDVVLANSGLRIRDGEVITTVWAARQDAQHGHCIFLQNHSSGEAARLHDNVKLIRPKAGAWQTARFGLFAAFPVAVAMLMWLLIPGSFVGIEPEAALLAGFLAVAVLFLVGFIASKLVFDYLRSEDEQKLWQVADRALADAHAALGERRA